MHFNLVTVVFIFRASHNNLNCFCILEASSIVTLSSCRYCSCSFISYVLYFPLMYGGCCRGSRVHIFKLLELYSVLYSHLHHHSASQRHNIKDRRMNKRRRIKTQEGRHKKTSLEKYSPLTLLQGFERLACEMMLETEHKLHILTPLLWPSRCVFLVLLDAQPEVLGSTPSGLFRGPPRLGVAFPTTSGL